MATEADIRTQIESARATLARETTRKADLHREITDAYTRQKLRRELDEVNRDCRRTQHQNVGLVEAKRNIDSDLAGLYMPDTHQNDSTGRMGGPHSGVEESDLTADVTTGEYVWKIQGISWLINALSLEAYGPEDLCICAPDEGYYTVGGVAFDFLYFPQTGLLSAEKKGTFGVRFDAKTESFTCRYKVLIKRSDGVFMQWGERGEYDHVLDEGQGPQVIIGPDVVPAAGDRPAGIFGLTHRELLASEWIVEDSFTFKILLEVRPGRPWVSKTWSHKVQVPPSTIANNLLALLEEGRNSDVTFLVQGHAIKAHSQILSARSEVFDREFNCGMRESVSREVVVEDCDPGTFKALLQFLYTDDFGPLQKLQHDSVAESSDSTGGSSGSAKLEWLQSLLAVSHKYQISRLHLWCQEKLCTCISVADVSNVLSLAALLEASQLEQECLEFIKQNKEAVVITPGFGSLSKEALLKVSLFLAGVPESRAAPALEAQNAAKRQRHE
eukprot:TRINITY_DN38948_c0_g1_i2.p1 TRINITY_DN38948_c0_g1~~TRINITY_DN38948_c0_g1_i2.p1  ORF type:complete len:520 (+),score=78.09 TRINITY_DN38948_c0_g1_i2:65-1561(+)